MSEQTTIRHIFYDWCKETYLEPTDARFEAFESGYARAGRSPAPAEDDQPTRISDTGKFRPCSASSIGWEEAIEAAAKVADETAALEDKHDRYEAYRAAHDIAQTIRSLPRPSTPAEDGEGLREALKGAQHYIKGTLDYSGHKKWVLDAIEVALSGGRDGRKT